jgi:nucleotide-binding universal stress UspA family protein
MLAIHNILHPTDFSPHSVVAFRLASTLARDHGANLVILHVVQEPLALYAEGAIPDPVEDHLDEIREQLLRIQPPVQDVSVAHRIEQGNPAQEILQVAQMLPADLIVMGTHGRRGLRRLLMGSVAEYVLERSTCPVLTVKSPGESDAVGRETSFSTSGSQLSHNERPDGARTVAETDDGFPRNALEPGCP